MRSSLKKQGGWIGAAIGAAAALIGGERRNSAQANQADDANKFSAEQAAISRQFSAAEAAKNRNYQTDMSNTMVQRRMADLRRSGINPILAANSAASSPSGVQPSTSAPTGQQAQIQDTITPAVTTAITANQSFAQVNTLKSQAKQLAEQADLTNAQSWLADIESALKLKSIDEKILMIEVLQEELKIRRREGELAETEYGTIMRVLREFTSSVLGGGSLVPKR